jgi:hypothetical protein
MSRKLPPEATRFVKGRSGNPGGRPKATFTVDKLRELFEKYGQMGIEEFNRAAAAAPVMERAVCAQLLKAAKGDTTAFHAILDRWIGKVKDVTESHLHTYEAELDGVPRENIIELLRKPKGA